MGGIAAQRDTWQKQCREGHTYLRTTHRFRGPMVYLYTLRGISTAEQRKSERCIYTYKHDVSEGAALGQLGSFPKQQVTSVTYRSPAVSIFPSAELLMLFIP